MFTIRRSGALALFLTALLTQNAQMQAFSFASVYNALKNNPGKTVVAVLSAAVAGYGLYKWLSPPPAKRTFKIMPGSKDGTYTLRVTTISSSKSFDGQEIATMKVAIDNYNYNDLIKRFKKKYGINKSTVDQMIARSKNVNEKK